MLPILHVGIIAYDVSPICAALDPNKRQSFDGSADALLPYFYRAFSEIARKKINGPFERSNF
jgi:hypothetical protein